MTLNCVNRLDKVSKGIEQSQIKQVAFRTFVDETPIRTGNARRNTYNKGDEIYAAYPYAKRLDQGWSHQSPQGMVKPTIQAVRDYIKRMLGK